MSPQGLPGHPLTLNWLPVGQTPPFIQSVVKARALPPNSSSQTWPLWIVSFLELLRTPELLLHGVMALDTYIRNYTILFPVGHQQFSALCSSKIFVCLF